MKNKKKVKSMTSYCYLADPIDHFKRDFIQKFKFKGANKLLIKKAAKIKNKNARKAYNEDLKSFFPETICKVDIKFESPSKHFNTNKEKYIFFDPPNGISYGKSKRTNKEMIKIERRSFGRYGSGTNYIHIEKIKNTILSNKDLVAYSIYQHFSYASRGEKKFRKDVKELLTRLKEIELSFDYAYVLKFKDFFIVTVSKNEDINPSFDFHKNLKGKIKSPYLSARYLEFQYQNNAWK